MSQETQFKPGQTGNTAGRPKSLRRAIAVASRQRTQEIAEALVQSAVEGNAAATALIIELQSPRGLING